VKYIVLILVLLLSVPAVTTAQTPNAEIIQRIEALAKALEDLAASLRGQSPDPIEPEEPTNIIHVAAGENLQAAVNGASPGSVITLAPGVEYLGTLTLPAKVCEPVTTITTAGAGLIDGTRVSPEWTGRLAVMRSGSVLPAIQMAEGTCGWNVKGIEFLPNNLGQHEVIEVGRAWDTKTLAGLPKNITLTHLLMQYPGPQKRAIGCNGINVRIEDSYITGNYMPGQDSQAIACWNTPGPIVIRNNHLEAGSEVIMFGGADPGITNVVVADVLVEGNTLTRPLAWKAGPTSTYVVKNLFEIKAGLRITVRNNLMFNHWQAAQAGSAIVFTPRNQDGRCTECRIEDVLFENNIVSDVSAGVNITAYDDLRPSGQTKRITIKNNYFKINSALWGGNGRFLQVAGDVVDLHIEHNTIEQNGSSFITAVQLPQTSGFRFVRNLIKVSGAYGIFSKGEDGNNYAHGLAWRYTFPEGVIEENAIADWKGNAASRNNLPGNLFMVSGDIFFDEEGYATGAAAGYGRQR
jgi:hypothetical protein